MQEMVEKFAGHMSCLDASDARLEQHVKKKNYFWPLKKFQTSFFIDSNNDTNRLKFWIL